MEQMRGGSAAAEGRRWPCVWLGLLCLTFLVNVSKPVQYLSGTKSDRGKNVRNL